MSRFAHAHPEYDQPGYTGPSYGTVVDASRIRWDDARKAAAENANSRAEYERMLAAAGFPKDNEDDES